MAPYHPSPIGIDNYIIMQYYSANSKATHRRLHMATQNNVFYTQKLYDGLNLSGWLYLLYLSSHYVPFWNNCKLLKWYALLSLDFRAFFCFTWKIFVRFWTFSKIWIKQKLNLWKILFSLKKSTMIFTKILHYLYKMYFGKVLFTNLSLKTWLFSK